MVFVISCETLGSVLVMAVALFAVRYRELSVLVERWQTRYAVD